MTQSSRFFDSEIFCRIIGCNVPREEICKVTLYSFHLFIAGADMHVSTTAIND